MIAGGATWWRLFGCERPRKYENARIANAVEPERATKRVIRARTQLGLPDGDGHERQRRREAEAREQEAGRPRIDRQGVEALHGVEADVVEVRLPVRPAAARKARAGGEGDLHE